MFRWCKFALSNGAKISEWHKYPMNYTGLSQVCGTLGSAFKAAHVVKAVAIDTKSTTPELIIQQLTAPLHLLSLLAGWIKYSSRGIYWLSTRDPPSRNKESHCTLSRSPSVKRLFLFWCPGCWQIGSISWTRNAWGRGGKKSFLCELFSSLFLGLFFRRAIDSALTEIKRCDANFHVLSCKRENLQRAPVRDRSSFDLFHFIFRPAASRAAHFTNPTGYAGDFDTKVWMPRGCALYGNCAITRCTIKIAVTSQRLEF